MVFVVNTDCDPFAVYYKLPAELIKHSENVGKYSCCLYKLALDSGLFGNALSKRQLSRIQNAVKFHDIGKSVYDPAFLYQSTRFTNLERKLMRWHVDLGLLIFQKTMALERAGPHAELFLETVYDAIAHHHEWFNGDGYPRGLRGEEISPVGQICAICDYYDALRSRRPYHEAMTHAQVVDKILAERGTHFNPKLVDLLIKHEQDFKHLKRWRNRDE